MEHLQSCGGVLYRIESGNVQVLVIFRRGFWDLPKGKREDGESIAMCAVREVSEEVGIPIAMIVSDLGTTTHTYSFEGIQYHKETFWFSMITRSTEFSPQQEEDIELVQWMNLDEAIKRVGFQNLKTVLGRFSRAMNCQKSDK
jgi:8-oxo-dGTP pyrophosphatase MutT (NUDIX family)